MTASARPGVAALAVVLAAASCGDPEPVYRWREGAAVSCDLRVREELLPHRIAREVQVALRGRAAAGPVLDLEVVNVRQERALDGRPRGSVVDTSRGAASPEGRDAEDAAAARVGERLLGRRVKLSFDSVQGLRGVDGMTAALAGAAEAGDAPAAEFRDGLVGLLSDEVLARTLRGAGLAGVPEDFRDASAQIERTFGVFLPGRGVLTCRLRGTAGFGHEGSPIVKHEGRVAVDAPATGDPGPAVPDEIGAVVVAEVRAEAETMHDLGTKIPLRGRLTVRTPYARAAETVVTTSFTLMVEP